MMMMTDLRHSISWEDVFEVHTRDQVYGLYFIYDSLFRYSIPYLQNSPNTLRIIKRIYMFQKANGIAPKFVSTLVHSDRSTI